jgi:uncharacterized protein (TIRG00374 family)
VTPEPAAAAATEAEAEAEAKPGSLTRKLVLRGLLLLVTLVSLYFLLPSLLEVFTSWRQLFTLEPAWVAGAVGFEIAAFVAIWELQRIALRTRSWFAVGTSQLAGNAFGRIVPGGMATAGALQYRMLVRMGVPGGRVATALTAVSALSFGILLALPLLALPAIIGGTPVAKSLETSAYLGAAVFGLMAVAGVIVFAFDRPLELVGGAIEWILNRTVRRRRRVTGLDAKLLRERDGILAVVGARWKMALLAAIGRWGFDYLALVAALYAVGAEADPSLVLLAYVAASLLGMIPLTPGGLGFVEAGLTGTLALAGVGASAAVVATLAYRLASFWLPIPAGAAAYWLFSRRYPGEGRAS